MRYYSTHKRLMPSTGGSVTAPDVDAWKGRSDGQERYHAAAQTRCDPNLSGLLTEGFQWASPFYNTRSATLAWLGTYTTVAGAWTDDIRIGIYDNVSGYNPYPNNLLLDLGAYSILAAGFQGLPIGGGLALVPNQLYWLSCTYRWLEAKSAQVAYQTAINSFPVCGVDTTLASPCHYLERGYGWLALPNPFPASAAMTMAHPCPLMYVRYSA